MTETVKTKLGTIEYSCIGQGLPILFLHGGHSNAQETLFQAGYDLTKFKLITPSRPGYGKTPLAGFEEVKAAAKLIVSLLDFLKIEKTTIIGISAGGLTAIALAGNFPERTQNLILISAVTQKWLKEGDKLYQLGKILFSPRIEAFTWKMNRFFFKLFPKMMAKVIFKELSSKSDAMQFISQNEIEALMDMVNRQSSGNGFVNDLDQTITEDTIEKIKCPTLLLHSTNDNSVSMEMASYALRKIQNAKLTTYDNKWGHLLWLGNEKQKAITDVQLFIQEEKSTR